MAINAAEFERVWEAINDDLRQAYNGNLSNRDLTIGYLADAKVKIDALIERMEND